MSDLDLRRLPKHVAIIPDGNGRWAKLRSEERTLGHVRGTTNVKEIVTFAKELGIQVLTIYAFSDENWQRPLQEVGILMDLLKQYLIEERETILKNKIQLRAMGTIDRLPAPVLEELKKTIELSSQNQEMILNFAVSYGSRSEIIQAIQKISQDVLKGKFPPEKIDSALLSQYLYTKDLPDPDLLIRTSGEMRISNFLLWQMAYTELYVTPTLWPDFSREEFVKALLEYQTRKRRFGLTEEQTLSHGCDTH
ncbi:MAG: isoprenyl transferase [Deltaproteobacteria bacterium]|nr:isoprenyl transferase [Deltaproteobacteria bacterium]